MNRSAKESHKRISDSRNFGLYLHLITFALNGTPKESPRANTEWPNLSHYNFRFRNKQTISAQNKLAYCNSAIIRSIFTDISVQGIEVRSYKFSGTYASIVFVSGKFFILFLCKKCWHFVHGFCISFDHIISVH